MRPDGSGDATDVARLGISAELAFNIAVWFRGHDGQAPTARPARVLVSAATQAGQQP
jgi:hypothetical protein